ncbi:hypothetical protein GPEL0_01r1713 [Geoanaerobacter pelophilus]|uniref:Uncharacterized protein n=1 Tax=Geoanaerobacter pelophilus TaxID=60036 RepID=A0ABQ0MH39_9BACT|nr:hypothetical protein [Geoanaerobacter pelophilus]GAW66377.1 hypothetical protein GPEL0_01r1713 [Geoanaerobacter pelophilus]
MSHSAFKIILASSLGLILSIPALEGAVIPASEAVAAEAAESDAESFLWIEVKKGGTREDYLAYLDEYPAGKYSALAKSRLKKMDADAANKVRMEREAATQLAVQEEQAAWDAANSAASEAGYEEYLRRYPSGLFAALVPARLVKVKKEANLHEEERQWTLAVGAGTSASFRAYINKYPNGRHVDEAAQKEEECNRVPARPQTPFAVSESVWRAIETSEGYRNTPRSKPLTISYQTKDQIEFTGSKSSTLPTPAATGKSVTKELTPIGGKCSVLRARYNYSQNNMQTSMDIYLCGSVPLGTEMNGKTATVTKSVELQGSLFPLRIGAEQSERVESAYIADSKYDSTVLTKWRVVGKNMAHELNPKLTGAAWALKYEMNIRMPGANMNKTTVMEDYYLEDLGIFLSAVGEVDMSKMKSVLPTSGSQTAIVAEGEYGSRTTSTYQNYELVTGK